MRCWFFVAALESDSAGVGSCLHCVSLWWIFRLVVFFLFFFLSDCVCVCEDEVKGERQSSRNTPQLGCHGSVLESTWYFVLTVSFSTDLERSNFWIKPRHMHKKKRGKQIRLFPARTSCYPSFLQPSPCLGAGASPVNQFHRIAKSVHSSLMRQQGTGMPEPWAPGRQDRRLKENKQSGRVTKCTSDRGHTQEAVVGGAAQAKRRNSDQQRFFFSLFFSLRADVCQEAGAKPFVVLCSDLQSVVVTKLNSRLFTVCLNCHFARTDFRFYAEKILNSRSVFSGHWF